MPYRDIHTDRKEVTLSRKTKKKKEKEVVCFCAIAVMGKMIDWENWDSWLNTLWTLNKKYIRRHMRKSPIICCDLNVFKFALVKTNQKVEILSTKMKRQLKRHKWRDADGQRQIERCEQKVIGRERDVDRDIEIERSRWRDSEGKT